MVSRSLPSVEDLHPIEIFLTWGIAPSFMPRDPMTSNSLNQVNHSELRREIGGFGLAKLRKLAFWLALPEREIPHWESLYLRTTSRQQQNLSAYFDLPARVAPSLISRAEVELFGCSVPRFALRLVLKDEQGFVNVRRLSMLAGQVVASCGTEYEAELLELILHAPCVADAFLSPPRRNEQWHILTSPLAKASGEVFPGQVDQLLTPYVRHMRPGGGMCAQAACFMASSLHSEVGAPLHGMPEVTYIATNTESSGKNGIVFEGLWTDEVAYYFNMRGALPWEVLASCQTKLLRREPNVLLDPESDIVLDLEKALESYIRSGMPVIQPWMPGACKGG